MIIVTNGLLQLMKTTYNTLNPNIIFRYFVILIGCETSASGMTPTPAILHESQWIHKSFFELLVALTVGCSVHRQIKHVDLSSLPPYDIDINVLNTIQ